MKSLINYLNEQLEQDLYLTYFQSIDESGGIYNGQIELASFITDEADKYIKENPSKSRNYSFTLKYSKEDLKEYDNIFFNDININFSLYKGRENINASSESPIIEKEKDLYKKYNYDKKEDKLNLIIIDIIGSENIESNWEKIRGRISHELNHLKTLFSIISDDLKNNDQKIPQEYHNILHTWKDNTYSKIIKILNDNNILISNKSKYISNLLIYSFTRFERNAFLSEICSYLFDKSSKLKKIESAKEEISKCPQYNIYNIESKIILDEIEYKWSKKDKKIFTDTYNEIYNTNKKFKEIIKIFRKKIDITIKKLNKNIDILCKNYRYMNENSISYQFSIDFNNPPIDIDWF